MPYLRLNIAHGGLNLQYGCVGQGSGGMGEGGGGRTFEADTFEAEAVAHLCS